MKKLVKMLFMILTLVLLIACGTEKVAAKEVKTAKNNTTINSNKKILIAYFSLSGNTENFANQIKETVGGDLFKVTPLVPYNEAYNEIVDRAADEQDANARPKIIGLVNNFESYDTIFIGYPNWWGTMPMIMFTFMESYNFNGKTIIPFCTHDGSGLGRSLSDLKLLAPNATILDGLAIKGKRISNSKSDVNDWLKELNLSK